MHKQFLRVSILNLRISREGIAKRKQQQEQGDGKQKEMKEPCRTDPE